jgi:hypothetical protein
MTEARMGHYQLNELTVLLYRFHSGFERSYCVCTCSSTKDQIIINGTSTITEVTCGHAATMVYVVFTSL